MSTKELIKRVDKILDEYGKMDRNYRNITGFVTSLLHIFMYKRNPRLLLKILSYEHPRPQSNKYWFKFAQIIRIDIKNLIDRPNDLLKFLGYLKWKSTIRNKLAIENKGGGRGYTRRRFNR